MNREDLFIMKDGENNREYLENNLKRRTKKLSVKDILVYNVNRIILPIGFDRRKDTIAIYGDRLGYFAKELSAYYNILSIGTMKAISVKDGWKQNIHFMMYRKWHRKIAEGYLNHDNELIDRQILEIQKMFKQNHVKFVIITDLYPVIQRAICLAAKNEHIPVAYYEHTSILDLKVDNAACDFHRDIARDYPDFYWYWCKKNKNAIVERKIATEENSTIIGYPYQIDRRPIEKRKAVLWIGEAEAHHSSRPEVCYQLVEGVYQYCKENDIEFTYRPHPKEKEQFYMPLVEQGMKLSTLSLAEDLEGNYIAIGAKTTSVLEAGLYDDLVIQVIWDEDMIRPFEFENAYILGADLEDITKHIDMAIKGEISPKDIPEETLIINGVIERAKSAIENNIRQYEDRK